MNLPTGTITVEMVRERLLAIIDSHPENTGTRVNDEKCIYFMDTRALQEPVCLVGHFWDGEPGVAEDEHLLHILSDNRSIDSRQAKHYDPISQEIASYDTVQINGHLFTPAAWRLLVKAQEKQDDLKAPWGEHRDEYAAIEVDAPDTVDAF